MFLALVLAAAPVPPAVAPDWQPALKVREFKFDDNRTGAFNSVAAAKKAGLTAEFLPDPEGRGGEFTFQKKNGPKVTFYGHPGTPAVVRGDAVLVADYSPIATGCTVAAYDLTTGKKVWTRPLKGLGPIVHTKYRNRVAMAVEKHPDADAHALVIVGLEAAGGYVEVLDPTTGKQLAHRKYELRP